jgi:hypothetical protein
LSSVRSERSELLCAASGSSKDPMQKLIVSVLAATSLLGVSATNAAPVAPPAHLISGVYDSGEGLSLTPAQYFYAGRNFCWYTDGWDGPGFYWCGYAWRRGLGWGGASGWNGWRSGARSGHSGAANFRGSAPTGNARNAVASVRFSGARGAGSRGGSGAHTSGGHASNGHSGKRG